MLTTTEKKRVKISNEVNEKSPSPDSDNDNDTDNDTDSEHKSAVFERIEDDIDSLYPQIGKTIVIDSGTYNIRIGISGDEEPLHIIDTVDKWESIKSINEQPIIYGTIDKWEYIESKWLDLISNKLKFVVTDHAMILTEPYDITKKNREKLTERIFESIQCPAFYVSPSSLFSLYSTGRTSGCVLDFAYDCTRIVPIYEGYVLQFNSSTIKIGGQHISSNLANNLEKNNKISQYDSFNIQILEDIKRKHCNLYANNDIDYKLPDGNIINITAKQCISCSDILFENNNQPFINNIYQSIIKCDKSSYSEMFNNVIICGGTSLINGITEKIKTDLNNIIKQEQEQHSLHVASPKNKQLSAWHGASIFSSLSSFNRALITIQEYEECGSRIVHHKCF